jgi:hypothetical protein
MIHQRESIKGSTKNTKSRKKRKRTRNQRKKTPKASSHWPQITGRPRERVKKKEKSKLRSPQDHQIPESPPHMTLTVLAQNRLHLPLIKRAGAARGFDRIPLSRKEFHSINLVFK